MKPVQILTSFLILAIFSLSLINLAGAVTCNGTEANGYHLSDGRWLINSSSISDGCTLSSAGNYTMSGETFLINGTSTYGSAITFLANNVQLNCNYSLLVGNGTHYGIYAIGKNNISVYNCNLNNYSRSVYMKRIDSINIFNISASNSTSNFFGDNLTNFYLGTSFFTNSFDSSVELITRIINVTVEKNTIKNSLAHCLTVHAAEGENYTLVGNYAENCTDYAFDCYTQMSNSIQKNNYAINALNGVVYSMAGGGIGYSNNLRFRNNTVFNLNNYGVVFNNVFGGISQDDYVFNGTLRGLSIATNVLNISVYNITIRNSSVGVDIHENANNILIENATIINCPISFIFSQNVSGVVIKDSLFDSLENHIGTIVKHSSGLLVYNITLQNVLGHSFWLENISSLNFTLSKDYVSFKAVGSTSEKVRVDLLTSALLTNGTSLCNGSSSNLALNTGQVNITLQPNEECWVYDSFNPADITRLESQFTIPQIRIIYASAGYNYDYYTVESGCTSTTKTGFGLVMILSSLILPVVIIIYLRSKDWILDMNDLILIFMTLIICLALWQVAGQNLGSACGVVS